MLQTISRNSAFIEHVNLLRFGPYFIEPVVAGLEEDGTPFIAGADLIGCLNFAKVRTVQSQSHRDAD